MNRRHFIELAATASSAVIISESDAVSSTESIQYYKSLPVSGHCDVAVCGGGPSGVAAAFAATSMGKRVILFEALGQLGGTSTSGLVSHWLGGRINDGSKWVVGGLFRTLAEEACSQGIALIPIPDEKAKYQPHGWNKGQLGVGIPFDPFEMAAFLDKKMQEISVDMLFNTRIIDVIIENHRITHLVIHNKSGISAVSADYVIDATGDADIAYLSACPVQVGREEDGLMTPATLEFHVDNIDQDMLREYIETNESPRFQKLIEDLRRKGEWPFPYDIFICVQLTEKGTMMINTSRLTDVDGTNAKSISHGMIRGRRETLELLEIMRKHIPGFSRARLKTVSSMMGIRETRRITGDYTLTVEDLISGNDFLDTIGYSAYGWDLPDPKKPSLQPMHERNIRKKRPVTPIPFRIMIPQNVENLVCPGRSVSVERDVLGPLRVCAPCFAMGEAAGTAVGLLHSGMKISEVDFNVLRTTLRNNGAIVDWE